MSIVQPSQPHLRHRSGRLISLVVAREEWLGGISRGHLSNLIARGEIPTVRVGRRRMIDTRDLEAFIGRNREVGAQTQETREPGSFRGSKGSRDELDHGDGST